MPRTLQFKRYGSATLANTIGANGELIINSTNQTLTVHDGVTPGGFTLLNEAIEMDIDQYARNTANTTSNNITIIQGVNTTQNTNITNATNLAQAAYNYANTIVSDTQIDPYARNTANTTSNNITIIQGVNDTQNTNITNATNLAQSAYNYANTIVSDTQIDPYARTTANTASNNIVILEGVNDTQNTNITNAANLAQAAYNYANTIVSDTQIDPYARTTANSASNNIVILEGVNTTQNTNIITTTNLAQDAYNNSNTKFNSSGGTISGNVTISGILNVESTINVNNVLTVSTSPPAASPSITVIATQNQDLRLRAVSNTWIFAQNGNTTFPTGVRLSNARGSNTVNFTTDVDKLFQIETQTAITSKLWNFDTDGTLSLPQSGTLKFFDNTIQNTAFTGTAVDQDARNSANAASQTIPQNAQSTNYTLQLTDAGKHIYYTQASNTILHIPTTSNVAFSNGSTIMIVSRTSSGANVTVSPNTGVTMYLAGNTTSALRNVTTYGMATLIQVAANTWFINGTGVS
jgi:Lon protease-like protein